MFVYFLTLKLDDITHENYELNILTILQISLSQRNQNWGVKT